MPHPITGSRSYRGIDLQHKVALDQLDAVNRVGTRLAANKGKGEEIRANRRELLKQFAKGERVTDGQKYAIVVGKDEKLGQLDVEIIPSRRPARWAPESVTTAPLKK
jgi:hypothetical protein